MQKTLIKDELATLRTLKRARRLIAKEENWCQVSMRIRYGKTAAFCAVGAVHETSKHWGPKKASEQFSEGLYKGAEIVCQNHGLPVPARPVVVDEELEK